MKNIKIIILALLFFFPSVFAISKSNIDFEILDEKVVDAPLKTSVVRFILIKGDLSKEAITDFTWKQYNMLKNKRGFRFHKKPTNVGVYLFIAKDHYKSGWGQWIAKVYNIVDKESPEIIYAWNFQELLESLTAKPETKFGLSEKQRKKIYKEIVWAEDKVYYGANKRSETRDKIEKRELNNLADKYNITKKELDRIGIEGLKKGWPMPPYKY